MSALRKTKACMKGLEDLNDFHFPGNDYSDPAVKLGKLHHVDITESTSSIASRAMECISWDIPGPMQSKSTLGHSFATVFVCAFFGNHDAWVYSHG